MLEPGHSKISLRRQCELLGLSRSSPYHEAAAESDENLHLMRLLDEQYTCTPFYSWPRITAHLRRQDYLVNHKRVQRLMQKIGLQVLYRKPRATQVAREHKVYPYLLRGLAITRPSQVWSPDITYLPFHIASYTLSPLSTGNHERLHQSSGYRTPAEVHFA